jgi:hypothetical protein
MHNDGMSEWRFVGAYPGLLRVPVPDSETISIGGINPWRYWRATIDERSDLPWPAPDPEWTGRAVFLRLLDGIETHAERIAYRGLSVCRVCSCHNGYEGLRLAGWEWPAGYRHYIADHGVRPSLAFENHILRLTSEFATR